LAKKLKECGVFGVSSDEYLNYAIHNRDEWKIKGESVVKSMIEAAKANSEPQRAQLNASEFMKRGQQRRLSLNE